MQELAEVVTFEPVAVRPKTAAAMLDCSETTIWKLCKEGKLRVTKVGADNRVTVDSIRRFAGATA
jgi:excisionase family DNA binding protein